MVLVGTDLPKFYEKIRYCLRIWKNSVKL